MCESLLIFRNCWEISGQTLKREAKALDLMKPMMYARLENQSQGEKEIKHVLYLSTEHIQHDAYLRAIWWKSSQNKLKAQSGKRAKDTAWEPNWLNVESVFHHHWHSHIHTAIYTQPYTHIHMHIMFLSNHSWWRRYRLQTEGHSCFLVNDSARLKWQLSPGELSAMALFNLPENYWEKHLTHTQHTHTNTHTQHTHTNTHTNRAGSKDGREEPILAPMGKSKWKVALKKVGKLRSKGLFCGEWHWVRTPLCWFIHKYIRTILLLRETSFHLPLPFGFLCLLFICFQTSQHNILTLHSIIDVQRLMHSFKQVAMWAVSHHILLWLKKHFIFITSSPDCTPLSTPTPPLSISHPPFHSLFLSAGSYPLQRFRLFPLPHLSLSPSFPPNSPGLSLFLPLHCCYLSVGTVSIHLLPSSPYFSSIPLLSLSSLLPFHSI